MSRLSHLPYKPPSFCPCQGRYSPPPSPIFSRVWGTPKEDHTKPALHKCGEGLQADGSPQPCKEMLAGRTLGRQAAWTGQGEEAASPAGGACDLHGSGDLQERRLRFPRAGAFSFSLTQKRLCTKGGPRWGGRPGSCPRAGRGPPCDLASNCHSGPRPLRVSRDRAGLSAVSSPV